MTTEEKKFLGERLREQREKKGLTQKEAAGHLNISEGAYQKLEFGLTEPKYGDMLKMAEFYNVPPTYFYMQGSVINHQHDNHSATANGRVENVIINHSQTEEDKGVLHSLNETLKEMLGYFKGNK